MPGNADFDDLRETPVDWATERAREDVLRRASDYSPNKRASRASSSGAFSGALTHQ